MRPGSSVRPVDPGGRLPVGVPVGQVPEDAPEGLEVVALGMEGLELDLGERLLEERRSLPDGEPLPPRDRPLSRASSISLAVIDMVVLPFRPFPVPPFRALSASSSGPSRTGSRQGR